LGRLGGAPLLRARFELAMARGRRQAGGRCDSVRPLRVVRGRPATCTVCGGGGLRRHSRPGGQLAYSGVAGR
jgi:hypothetical protein